MQKMHSLPEMYFHHIYKYFKDMLKRESGRYKQTWALVGLGGAWWGLVGLPCCQFGEFVEFRDRRVWFQLDLANTTKVSSGNLPRGIINEKWLPENLCTLRQIVFKLEP